MLFVWLIMGIIMYNYRNSAMCQPQGSCVGSFGKQAGVIMAHYGWNMLNLILSLFQLPTTTEPFRRWNWGNFLVL